MATQIPGWHNAPLHQLLLLLSASPRPLAVQGNMPRAGDVMIMKSDGTLKHVEDFTAQIQTLDIPGELKVGYSPIGFVRCGRSACRVTTINWKARVPVY